MKCGSLLSQRNQATPAAAKIAHSRIAGLLQEAEPTPAEKPRTTSVVPEFPNVCSDGVICSVQALCVSENCVQMLINCCYNIIYSLIYIITDMHT